MTTLKKSLGLVAAALLALGVFAGCESPEGGSSVSGGVYYGTGFVDPWYHGGYDAPDHIVVAPPPARPEPPIHNPSAPRPTPLPSLPAAPRPMPATRR